MNCSAKVLAIQDLVAFWDFQETAGSPRRSQGNENLALIEANGEVPTRDDGVFGPRSACFGHGAFLYVPRNKLGGLNICGKDANVSVVAWIKRHPTTAPGCQAVAGIWNEHALRQYCLFLNLQIWESSQQVCGHISGIGDRTPGFKYCMDAAIGATPVDYNRWHCCAMTYDAQHIRAYLDGKLDQRDERNPYAYPLGIFDPGTNGADFTVGAVSRPERVDENFKDHGNVIANCFHGQLGGLAIFRRALSDAEISSLAHLSESRP